MARKRDPQQLLERAQQMEEEARRIREEADRIRREREAQEDRKAGALLRRFWKTGWSGVDLPAVIEAVTAVFGEAPGKQTTVPASGTSGDALSESNSGADRGAHARPNRVPGELFPASPERTDDDA